MIQITEIKAKRAPDQGNRSRDFYSGTSDGSDRRRTVMYVEGTRAQGSLFDEDKPEGSNPGLHGYGPIKLIG